MDDVYDQIAAIAKKLMKEGYLVDEAKNDLAVLTRQYCFHRADVFVWIATQNGAFIMDGSTSTDAERKPFTVNDEVNLVRFLEKFTWNKEPRFVFCTRTSAQLCKDRDELMRATNLYHHRVKDQTERRRKEFDEAFPELAKRAKQP